VSAWTLADQWAAVAESHRRMAERCDGDEQAHWELEAERFDELACLARTDVEKARAAYRPTQAYSLEETS